MATLGFLIVSLLSLLQERRTVYISRLSREAPPDGFKLRESPIPPQDTMLRMIIGMPQNNWTGVERALLDISDPYSPNYGNHWSRDQVRVMFIGDFTIIDNIPTPCRSKTMSLPVRRP